MRAVLLACAAADAPWVDLWKADGAGGGAQRNMTSLWGPSLVLTKDSTLIAFAECDRSPTEHDGWMGLTRSLDGGRTWEPPRELYGCGSPVAIYSRSTDTVLVTFGVCTAPRPPGPP